MNCDEWDALCPEEQDAFIESGWHPGPVVTSDFRPRARIENKALMRLLKYEYDECSLTGVTINLHLHHVIFKSHGGDDLRENIICMADWLHERYHKGDPLVKRMLADHVEHFRSDVAAYISEKLGSPGALVEWFERHHA